jgi:copper(I)-binding protein
MKHLVIALGALLLTAPNSAFAFEPETTEQIKKSIIEVQNPYAFATMPGATTGAAFMVLNNIGQLDDTLIGVKSKVAQITEIHQNIIDPDDDTMMMRKVKSISLPLGKQVTLEPKGYHIMFIKMKETLALNDIIDLTLMFEHAGEVKTKISVVAPGIKPKIEKKMPWDTSTQTLQEKIDDKEPPHIETNGALSQETLEERTDY